MQPIDPLAGFPTIITLPVQWGDQDAFLHVNNTVYIRWCESARIAYLDQTGLSESMERDKIGPILAAISCNYRRPVTYPDTIRCGARITRLGRSSLSMEHRIYSETQQAVVADAESTLVVYDYDRQASHPIPDDIRQAIEKIEGGLPKAES
jgi:acyl-CoA thioester hydrolase